MHFKIEKIYSSDYDQHGKKTFYVDVKYSSKFICESACIYRTYEFYDEEKFNFSKQDFVYIKNNVVPLIHEKILNEKGQVTKELLNECNKLNQQQNK